MARLTPIADGTPWMPPAEALIGRSPLCTLRLSATDVSKEHATLRWVGDAWELRDLGSRNGTYVAGKRLNTSERASLLAGTVLRFGATAGYTVDDDGPPPAMARREDTGTWVAAAHRMLVLPNDEHPEATVHQDGAGRWILELDGVASEVHHADLLIASGVTWRLSLPSLGDRTAEVSGRLLRGARLRFRVSSDEEHVSLLIHTTAEAIDLKSRAHHHVALALARARLRDVVAGVPPAEQGWVYHDELARMMATERTHVNVAIHRLRRQLEDAGFVDAPSCIERRLSSGQLRLGIAELEVLPAS